MVQGCVNLNIKESIKLKASQPENKWYSCGKIAQYELKVCVSESFKYGDRKKCRGIY